MLNLKRHCARAMVLALWLTVPLPLALSAEGAFAGSALPDAGALIAGVDALRFPAADSVTSTSRITTTGQGPSRSYRYQVRSRGGGTSSLVEALDGDQRGQKYLSVPQGYWFYAPRTRRAVRMSPLQVLRGQASIGDIARLRFGPDYATSLHATPSDVVDGRNCWVVDLKATSNRATYAQVTMWIAKSDGAPVKADLMAQSGRKLKTVLYGQPVSTPLGRVIQTTTYIDGVDPHKQTRVETLSVSRSNNPAALFRPEALSLG